MGKVEFVSLAALVREGDGCGARAVRAVDLACAGGGYGKEIAASAAVGVADCESLVDDGHHFLTLHPDVIKLLGREVLVVADAHCVLFFFLYPCDVEVVLGGFGAYKVAVYIIVDLGVVVPAGNAVL